MTSRSSLLFLSCLSLNAHPPHPAFTAELGPVHWVLGSTFMTELGPLGGIIHLVVVLRLVSKRRKGKRRETVRVHVSEKQKPCFKSFH